MGTGGCLPGASPRHRRLIPAPSLPAAKVISDPPTDAVAVAPARAPMGVTADTAARARAAVGSEAPASPRKPLLRLIISVVSCRVHETVRVFPAVPEAACPAARRPAQSRTCRSRLRQERALDSEDLPRFMRLAMGAPRP
jgi:hypothetical protein